MINVGLYGDSFGTGSLPKLPNGSYDTGFNFHWSKLLEKELHWSIDNYAVSGSSIFESYVNFLDNHHKYKKNLFIITQPGRYHASLNFKNYKHRMPDDVVHITNLGHLESWYNIHRGYLREEDHILLKNLKGWYIMQDYKFEIITCTLMIENIKKLRPDTLFIRVTEQINVEENFPLVEIYKQQCRLLDFDCVNININENTSLISGHFTPEINKLVADYIKDRIINGSWRDWKIPDNFSFTENKKVYFNIN
jgi:hypothetical protein